MDTIWQSLQARLIPAHAGNTRTGNATSCTTTVHPRARGEHVRHCRIGQLHLGSSPRTRGTLLTPQAHAHGDRFIPAHAGNTPPLPRAGSSPPVHPRARGEHPALPSNRRPRRSSSPRTRGTRVGPRRMRRRQGVHPRARGEHAGVNSVALYLLGSSPRTRGTPSSCASHRTPTRFIPAHVGEHQVVRQRGHARAGSSPRTRGTRRNSAFCCRTRRFIPAHAGNTWPPVLLRGLGAVHPRARGEHATQDLSTGWKGGSSPRTRGTLRSAPQHGDLDRFIPAHAGNTCPSFLRHFPNAVHPRARGEHARVLPVALVVVGSSPRTRGTRSTFMWRFLQRRFIPAHAGNTRARGLTGLATSVHPRARGEHSSCRGVALLRKITSQKVTE